MSALANPPRAAANSSFNSESSTSELLSALAAHRGKRLVFRYDGRDVLAGYHVTEVKAGQFASLDCGANPEAWAETFIQLWDVPAEAGRAPLSVDTFLAIMRKVAADAPLITEARLTFEVSDGLRPMSLYRAEGMEANADLVRVNLAPRASSCKPRDRWLTEQTSALQRCCGPATAKASCCA